MRKEDREGIRRWLISAALGILMLAVPILTLSFCDSPIFCVLALIALVIDIAVASS